MTWSREHRYSTLLVYIVQKSLQLDMCLIFQMPEYELHSVPCMPCKEAKLWLLWAIWIRRIILSMKWLCCFCRWQNILLVPNILARHFHITCYLNVNASRHLSHMLMSEIWMPGLKLYPGFQTYLSCYLQSVPIRMLHRDLSLCVSGISNTFFTFVIFHLYWWQIIS